jgi:hypothetical protein
VAGSQQRKSSHRPERPLQSRPGTGSLLACRRHWAGLKLFFLLRVQSAHDERPARGCETRAGTPPRDGTAESGRTAVGAAVMWLPANAAAGASPSGLCGAIDGAWRGSCAAPDAAGCGLCAAADVAPCPSVRPPAGCQQAGRSAGWAVGPQPLISAGWRQVPPQPTRPVLEKKGPFDARSLRFHSSQTP